MEMGVNELQYNAFTGNFVYQSKEHKATLQNVIMNPFIYFLYIGGGDVRTQTSDLVRSASTNQATQPLLQILKIVQIQLYSKEQVVMCQRIPWQALMQTTLRKSQKVTNKNSLKYSEMIVLYR